MTHDEIVAAIQAEGQVNVGNWTYTANDTVIAKFTEYVKTTYGVDIKLNYEASQAPSTYITNLYTALQKHLEDEKPARAFVCAPDERAIITSVNLLTDKPVIYAANLDEDGFADYVNNEMYQKVAARAKAEGSEVLPICAKLEQDILDLPPEERGEFLKELGITESGLSRLIKVSYRLLGLISYLTGGPKEVRAWTIERGTKAPQAAGKIHTDFERGFIRAECVSFDELMACGSMTVAREKGLVRSEGRDYVMRDGDVVLYRFNV